MALITDPDDLNQGIEITITPGGRTITLNIAGNLSNDGVVWQAAYSFLKEEWKNDPLLIPHPFPVIAITPEQFELVEGWTFVDDTTRKLLRTGGWSEIDSSGILQEQHTGIGTLGTFEDGSADTAYYQFGTDTTVDDTVDFDFAGPVNEAIRSYQNFGNPDTCDFATATTITRATGSFVTDGYKVGGSVTVVGSTSNDGTYEITAVAALTLTCGGATFTTGADTGAELAVDNRNALTVRLRVRDADPNGKTYAQAALADIGVSSVDNKFFRFPLSNQTDLKIAETDANIDANTPYTGMSITYHSTPQSRNIGGSSFDFGVIIDGNNASAEEIYEFVQRQLRLTSDIDNDGDTLIGRSADQLLEFVGDTLKAGTFLPINPDGGGSGVYIDNFDSNDTNRLEFVDNTSAVRTFPFVAAGTISFNSNLVSDTNGCYWMFFEFTRSNSVSDMVLTSGTNLMTSAGSNLPAATVNDYVNVSGLTGVDEPMNGVYQITAINTPNDSWTVSRYDNDAIATTTSAAVAIEENPINSPDAILVDNNSGVDITGPISAATISFDFDYDGNVQGGRTAATDAAIILRAIGFETAQFVEAKGTITRATGLSFSLVSGLERNYENAA